MESGFKNNKGDVSLLTERMRTATKGIHGKSDRLVNMKLAFVLTSKRLYGESLGLFAPIYERLEIAVERHRSTKLGPVAAHLEEMRRFPGFQRDLLFYLGHEDLQTLRQRQKDGPPKALQEYLEHLDSLEREDPMLLAVYLYHMYMAILAGGYVIRRIVKGALRLKSDEGVRALSFPSTVDCRELRKRLKHCINEEMKYNKEQEDRVMEESVRLFQLNNALVGTVRDSATEIVAQSIWWFQILLIALLALFCARHWSVANTESQ